MRIRVYHLGVTKISAINIRKFYKYFELFRACILRINDNLISNVWVLLQKSQFCVVFRGNRLAQPVLLEAIASGCVPIVLSDTLIMPFQEVIDWKR